MPPPARFWKTTILTAASVLAGAALGWMLRPAGKTADPVVALTPSGRPVRQSDHAPLPKTLERIEALRLAGPPSAQIAAAVAFTQVGAVAEIRDLLENRHLFSDLAAETIAVQALLKRWLELEPETAMEYCRTRCPDALRDTLSSYALTYPAEAGAIVDKMPEGTAKTWAWKRVCLGVAQTNPAAAWEMLQHHPKEGEHEAARIAGKLAALDLPGALTRLESLPKSVKNYAEAEVAIAFMDADPGRAWDWISRQPDPVFMMNQTISHVMDSDPDKAFALLATLTPEQTAGQVWGFSGNRREGFAEIAEALARSPLDPAGKL